jgi:dTDP-glucose 4,6-dehydratase
MGTQVRALVTGGAGFFGHHVVEHLLKNTDWHIVVLDKLNYASKGFDRLRDIGVYRDERITRLTADLSTRLSDGVIYEIGAIDYVLHLAAETHVDNSIRDPRPFVLSNVVGTFELLDLSANLLHPKAFVYFSTDEVFGPASSTPLGARYSGVHLDNFIQYREWDRYNSTNPYSATKAGGEELVLAYANTYSLPCIITHCMNLFGERQHPEKFIPHVISKVLNGELIHIHADKQRMRSGSRSYIHARNAADAVLHLLLKYRDHNGRDKWNITGEREMSNWELAEFIADHLGLPLHAQLVDFHSSRPGHDLRYALDGTKLARAGWKSPVGFDASLRKTIDWYMANKAWLKA